MSGPLELALLVLAVIVMTPVAEKVRLPQPVVLTVVGIAFGLVPGVAAPDLPPEWILPAVLPPLLFAATQRTSSTEFREHAAEVLLLAVGLTIATTAVAAVVAHAVGVPWTAAWVLGAIVSPPDPVAATAVARRLRLPHRLVTILEGEGMFNDATALVLYKVTLIAAVGGSFSAGRTGLLLVLTVVVGGLVGWLLARATRLALLVVDDPYTETTVTVLVPFVTYVLAERLEGSGVLAVLVLGLSLRNIGHEVTTSQGWLLGRSVWAYADFLITSLAFAVLGVEVTEVMTGAPLSDETVTLAISVAAAIVVFRVLWVVPSAWLARVRARRSETLLPVGWRETAVVSWSGMRGVVTVAAALALPETVDGGGDLPWRTEMVVAALFCVLVTLVVQGLTLAPLTTRLGVGGEDGSEREVADLRARAAQAALDFVQGEASASVAEEVRRAAVLRYDGFLSAQRAMDEARRLETDDDRDPPEELRMLLRRSTDVERSLVLDARRLGEVSAASADEVLRDIEARALRDFG
ncbi:MAG: sodium:proton antiporter [Nocardioidaceae bacterium]